MAIAKEIIAAEQTRTAFRMELEAEGALVILNYLSAEFNGSPRAPLSVVPGLR